MTEEGIIDKSIDREKQSTREQEQQKVHKVSVKNLEAWFGTKQALKNINFDVKEKTVTAFIGPSGCGKTTLLRCLNRMHDLASSLERLENALNISILILR